MADESEIIKQDEIEALLQQSKSSSASESAPIEPVEEISNEVLGQDEIEALLNQSAPSSAAPAAPTQTTPSEPAPPAPARPAATTARVSANEGPSMAEADAEFLLQQAEQALASVDAPRDAEEAIEPFHFEEFGGALPSTDSATLELIREVELDVRIELGRTQMNIEDVLKLRSGSVVSLDKLAGDPVDIFVNDRLVARGEVLVLNENFCVRVNELIAGQKARTA